jgi:hypothetical protein
MELQQFHPILSGLIGGACHRTRRMVERAAVHGTAGTFIAFAESEIAPPFLTFAILGLGVAGFLFALGGLLTR